MKTMLITAAALAFICVLTLVGRRILRRKFIQRRFEELRTKPGPATDFTTPEGAILSLEAAYRAKDLEAAVACKDFTLEARLMLRNLGKKSGDETAFDGDTEVLALAAETLELAYRKEIEASWPNLEGVESHFDETTPHAEGVVVVTEFGRSADGTTWMQRLLVGHTPEGWRVLNPL